VKAIECRGLEKRYGRVRALAGLELAVPQGALLLVAGPNGAGKTTLLRILAGLTRPTRGELALFGENALGSGRAALRARVAYVGQESALYGELAVQENLAFAARLCGAPAERVAALVEELDLGAVAHRRVRELSLGYRRRAGLARALLAQPDLVLLDEPWNGLDAAAAARLTRRLEQSRAAGATALVAAHDPGERARVFDGEIRLEAGRLAAGPGARGA
jgi:heme ABC exporter ATP-binding subunit CcmA